VTDTTFELRSRAVAGAVVIEIAGEIDMATAPEVTRAIDAGHDDAQRVVIDLSEVTFLDSSALNALVHCQRDLATKDIAFRIVSPSDRAVRNVFEITHLTEPLSVVESLDDALMDS
jgi:anti-sigma B factor antagonist